MADLALDARSGDDVLQPIPPAKLRQLRHPIANRAGQGRLVRRPGHALQGPLHQQGRGPVLQVQCLRQEPTHEVQRIAGVKAVARSQRRSGPLRIGLHRRVPPADAEVASGLRWRTVRSGVAGVFTVRSPGTKFIRAALDADLPEGAELRFFSPSASSAAYPSVCSPQMPAQGRPFWTPTVAGDAIGAEVMLRHVVDVGAVRLRVRRVAHPRIDGVFCGGASVALFPHGQALHRRPRVRC